VSLASRLGLSRPELRAWALYDWANSAFVTTVITAMFPTYFQKVAARGLPEATAASRYAFATTAALALVAVMAPVLGAIADRAPVKKRMLAAFMIPGVAATAALALVGPGDWVLALGLFALANIGVAGSFVFYDALLPHIARGDELHRVSTAGYALGYVGGGILLAINLVMIQKPDLLGLPDSGAGVRASFVSVAIWWAVFALPLFRRVPEPAVTEHTSPGSQGHLVRDAVRDLRRTLGQMRRHRHAFLFLIAFLLYNDGIQTIIRMAALFGSEAGIGQGTLIGAILAVQFIGVPCSFLFGQIAGWIGPKRAIFAGIAIYAVVCLLASRIKTAADFWTLAVLVGLVQGGTQALSRSVFASMIPAARSAEFFGLFAVFEKFAGLFGPLLFGLATLATGSSRAAIASVLVFFVLGGVLLGFVDVSKGQRDAETAAAG
jgi:UMF1 family MFS transporter